MNLNCPKHIADMLFESGIIGRNTYQQVSNKLHMQMISSDGSLRVFFRIIEKGVSLCVGVSPLEAQGLHLEEASSAISIGRHLYSKKIPVPQILAANKQTGVILFEDCGDTRLYDIIKESREQGDELKEKAEDLYQKTIQKLVHMQIEGANAFDTSWCYDTPEYNLEVMVKKESEYFLRAFWCELLKEEKPSGVSEEFGEIAANAALGLPLFFLHRDFQCRNIMVVDFEVKFIDFQGGRLGPPGYDLASLLIDPYSMLDESTRNQYLQLYLNELHNCIEYREDIFLKQYSYLVLQRNLQIIGAFAFLYKTREKIFFKKYIKPALENLSSILQAKEFHQYRNLRAIVDKAASRINHYL